jgi:F420-0:gamma-glutamyl ligase
MGLQVVATDLLAEGEIVRHDSRVAAEIAMDLARRGREKRRKIRVLGEK